MFAANTAAIILSAGRSSRMGKFKPLLPVEHKTVLEQVVDTFLHAGLRDIRVVLGYRARDVMDTLNHLPVCWCINEDYQSEMFNSVKRGVGNLSHDTEAFFIQPVDIPLVRPETLQLLMGVAVKETHQIVYPTFLGKRGHPPLIPRQYAGELRQWTGDGGLKGFLEQYDPVSLDIPVFDEGILMDMDTPGQYGRIVARYEKRRIPSKAECRAIMASRFSEDHPVVKHGQAVARMGQRIAHKLIQNGCRIDVDLLGVCGYLHDIGRGERAHAQFGADLMNRLGYPHVSEVIASHMDLAYNKGRDITEKEVIYLADKLILGESLLTLEKRLESKLKQLADNPGGKKGAQNRIGVAMEIQHTIETITGEKMNDLIEAWR
jgi:molybdenum cofactor cytidylyltransferase